MKRPIEHTTKPVVDPAPSRSSIESLKKAIEFSEAVTARMRADLERWEAERNALN